ncbi:MAG: penicillin-binding protein 2, penicillin-binding protein 2 [Parcubacteria group bacterium]|nr:penicillin-binding protein 2, penicillin-binding protein 2 [Parcubacteria group bacterium]
MPRQFLRRIRKRIKGTYRDIDPEDIFIDSANLPGFDTERFQGRIERPVGGRTFFAFKITLVVFAVLLVGKLANLEIMKGTVYAQVSENNRLDHTLIFANRGLIIDRKGVELASNGVRNTDSDFASRIYPPLEGLASVVGYAKYPSKDSSGHYYDTSFHGLAGVEKVYDAALQGTNGLNITETDARGGLISENVLQKPIDGKPLALSLDAGVTQALYKAIKSAANERGFTGGAGVIMDVNTGEILAMTSYPDYDQNVMADGSNKTEITRLLTSSSTPLLNRAVNGLYTPGSIVKPVMAIAAQDVGVIDPLTKILSTGSISVPNPYDPSHPSVFKDWRPQGWMTMRDALAVSSDVYFYEVGGGFGSQKGIGIDNIDKYFSLFGMTTKTGIDLPGEVSGTIASIDWKAKNFPNDPWRLGDTYHTAIGQYGTQVTPVEAVRWVSAVANGGKLLVPSVLLGGKPLPERISSVVDVPQSEFEVVREGMRQGVVSGITGALNIPGAEVAAKSGTAELGVSKARVNSWITGFWPFNNPRYAFALILEKGPVTNLVGAASVMRQVLDYIQTNAPEYLK